MQPLRSACRFVRPSPGLPSSQSSLQLAPGVCRGRVVTAHRRSQCENNRYPGALRDISSLKVRSVPPQQTLPFIYTCSPSPKMSTSVILPLHHPPPPPVPPPPFFSATQRRAPLIPPYIHRGHRFVCQSGQRHLSSSGWFITLTLMSGSEVCPVC